MDSLLGRSRIPRGRASTCATGLPRRSLRVTTRGRRERARGERGGGGRGVRGEFERADARARREMRASGVACSSAVGSERRPLGDCRRARRGARRERATGRSSSPRLRALGPPGHAAREVAPPGRAAGPPLRAAAPRLAASLDASGCDRPRGSVGSRANFSQTNPVIETAAADRRAEGTADVPRKAGQPRARASDGEKRTGVREGTVRGGHPARHTVRIAQVGARDTKPRPHPSDRSPAAV